MATTLEAAPPPAPATREKPRDTYFDNAKFLAIILVVVGHVIAPLNSSVDEARNFYLFLYAFHMPVFILVTGYLSRRFPDSPNKVRKLATLAAPFVVFQAVYIALNYAIGPGSRNLESGPSLDLFDPFYLVWFLMVVMIYRITSPFWQAVRWPIAIAICLTVFAGTQNLVDEFEMGRALGLLPFFVIGMKMRPEHFEFLRRGWVRVCSAVFLAAALTAAMLFGDQMTMEWVFWRSNNSEIGVDHLTGSAMRLIMLTLALALVAAFLSLIPKRSFWFSKYGAVTIYVYLLHGLFNKSADYLGWYEQDWIRGRFGVLVCCVLAVGIVFLLSAEPVRRVTRFVVEPPVDWLFRKPATESSSSK